VAERIETAARGGSGVGALVDELRAAWVATERLIGEFVAAARPRGAGDPRRSPSPGG